MVIQTSTRNSVDPPSSQIIDADYWRQRADEALTVAYEMTDPRALSKMLAVVKRYDARAVEAETKRRP
jgi:hypothetical protein